MLVAKYWRCSYSFVRLGSESIREHSGGIELQGLDVKATEKH